MEAEGLVSEANWSSFDPAMSVDDVMAHLFGFNDQDHEPNFAAQSVFWSDQSADSYYSSDNTNCNPYYWPQGNCNAISTSNIISGSTSYLHVLNGHESYYFHDANADAPEPMSLITADEQPSLPVCPGHRSTEGVILINKEAGSDEARGSMENPSASLLPSDHCSQAMIKRRLHEAQLEKPADDGQLQSSKKKARISKPVPKKGKNAQSKRLQKSISAVSIDAESNGDTIAQSSSEDDTSASPELIGGGTSSSCSKGSGSLILNGKKRADRGSATDPQSLYARKRRERINERLKVLQNLVPNGTKVDISTMLEEAVQYVKFLQLQIKLLSSDELWMYAPIAYNGMNLGFDLKISQPSQFPRGVNSSINTGH